MKAKIKHYIKEILLFVVVMTIFANLLSLYKSQSLNSAPMTLDSVKLIDNSLYKFKEGEPILIHLWATWCPTCKLEAPNIQKISQDFQVVTFAVNSGTNEEIANYLKERDLTFHVVNDKESLYAQDFKISGYPTTFIYDKDRKLVFSEVGYTSTLGLYLRMWWASL